MKRNNLISLLNQVAECLDGGTGGSFIHQTIQNLVSKVEACYMVTEKDFPLYGDTDTAEFWSTASERDLAMLISIAWAVCCKPDGRGIERAVVAKNVIWAIGPQSWMMDNYGSFLAWKDLRNGNIHKHWQATGLSDRFDAKQPTTNHQHKATIILAADENTVTDDDLNRIIRELKLDVPDAAALRTSYDHLDLCYMVSTGKEPPTAAQLAIAFGKYANGLRVGDECWSALDTDALMYATGVF